MALAPPPSWLETCITQIGQVQVAVCGDFCLDAYWSLQTDSAEVSLETGQAVHRVRQQRYSLGGAGNVIANLKDLGVRKIRAIGMVGDDLFGEMLLRQLRNRGIDTAGMYAGQEDWQTMVYAKPYMGDQELNRLDFGSCNILGLAALEKLVGSLEEAAATCQTIILNQQAPQGVCTPALIARINEIIRRHPQTRFVVDARQNADLYQGASLKLNAHEAARLAGDPHPLEERIPAAQAVGYAQHLWRQTHQPVFVTRGENGILVADQTGCHEIPGIQIIDRVDPVGAGDTTVAALAAVLGTSQEATVAATFANIAASITVRKLQTTGTANPEELRAAGPNPDYVYLPELADDPRPARYLEGTEIEMVRDLPAAVQIKHAIFDHDGTLSVLREGWEKIMEPMMVRAILGPRYQTADEALYHKITAASRQFIDKTTGIQTLVQMQGLVELVRYYKCVPEAEILDAAGYKKIYNDELLKMVQLRVKKLAEGELDSGDFQIKNAGLLLQTLHQRGIKMYLASGTDQADVIAEANAMGYGHLFEGRIYGAVGDVKVEAKKIVLERIMRENQLAGHNMATFGDGPVEIRETRKHGGIGIGLASDEVRRFGLNLSKRSRLIRAGADLIIPDFSQLDSLLRLLGI